MLALMALITGLVYFLPDDEDAAYALESATDRQQIEESAAAPGALDPQRSDQSERTTSSVRSVAGDIGRSADADAAQLALATDAALSGAEHSLANGAAIISFADEMARAVAASKVESTTTTAAPTPTAPKTTRPPTTTAPTTSAAADDPQPSAEESSSTAAGETPEPAPDESETTAAEDPSTTEPTTETAVAEPTTTTAPPETTAAAGGWVDTGNGVLVPPVLLAIRYCESRDNYTAANPASSARGGYQFLTGSWAGYGHKDRYGVSQAHLATPAQQDEAALITWQADGTRPWNASRSCWSKRI